MPVAEPAILEVAAAPPSASERLVDQLANRIGGLGVELADVAGNLQEVAGRVSGQSERFGHLKKIARASDCASANHRTYRKPRRGWCSRRHRPPSATSPNRARWVETAVKHIAELIDAVRRIELKSPVRPRKPRSPRSPRYPGRSRRYAPGKTRLLALERDHRKPPAPATREEVLPVVANEVKNSAEATRAATRPIGETVRDLDGQVGNLICASGDASLRAKSAGEGAQQIQSIIVRVQDGFTAVGQEIDGVAKAATSNLAHCDMVIDELGNLAKGVDLSSTDLKHADERVAKLLDLSEGLIELIADSGGRHRTRR